MATVKKEVKNKFYVVTKEIGENDKCPPQARLIVSLIKAAGGRMGRDELLAALKQPAEKGGLKTNQTAERILGFYKPKLAQMGVMKEEVQVSHTEVEVPDKPAKETKAAGAAAAESTHPKEGAKNAKGTPKSA